MHLNVKPSYAPLSHGVAGRNARSGYHRNQQRGCRPGLLTSVPHVRHCAAASNGKQDDAKSKPESQKVPDKPTSQDVAKTIPPKQAGEPSKPASKPPAPQQQPGQAKAQQPPQPSQAQPSPRSAPQAPAPVQQRKQGSSRGQVPESDWGSADSKPDRIGTSDVVICPASSAATANPLALSENDAAVCRILCHRILHFRSSLPDNYPVSCHR